MVGMCLLRILSLRCTVLDFEKIGKMRPAIGYLKMRMEE